MNSCSLNIDSCIAELNPGTEHAFCFYAVSRSGVVNQKFWVISTANLWQVIWSWYHADFLVRRCCFKCVSKRCGGVVLWLPRSTVNIIKVWIFSLSAFIFSSFRCACQNSLAKSVPFSGSAFFRILLPRSCDVDGWLVPVVLVQESMHWSTLWISDNSFITT